MKHKHSIDEELQLENVTYRSWARGSLYDMPGEFTGAGSNTATGRVFIRSFVSHRRLLTSYMQLAGLAIRILWG